LGGLAAADRPRRLLICWVSCRRIERCELYARPRRA